MSSFSNYLVTKSVLTMLGKRHQEIWPQFLLLRDLRRDTAFLYLNCTYRDLPNRDTQCEGKEPSPSHSSWGGDAALRVKLISMC